MSISNTTRKAGPFVCNGVTTAFPFTFKVFKPSEVVVTLTNDLGVVSSLTLGTGFSVALNDNQDTSPGGTVTTTTAYEAGSTITLTSDVQPLQPIVLTNSGGFYPKVINDGFDRLTILIQQQAELNSRQLTVPIGETIAHLPPKAQRQNSIQGFDVNGDPTVVGFPNIQNLANLRSYGIDILDTGDADAVQADVAPYLIEAMADAKRWGIGRVNFPGKGFDFCVKPDYATYGDFTYQDGTTTVPFKRGVIPLVSNVALVGQGARLYHEGGQLDPGGMFYTPFWESDGQIENVAIIGLELDANIANQTVTQYLGAATETGLWMHGHGIYCGSMDRLIVKRCKIHGFIGHAVFAFAGGDKYSEHISMIENDIYDNLQGGYQGSANWFLSAYNYYHGDGGWTGLGPNVELAGASEGGQSGRYIRSLYDTFDGRDGLSSTYATQHDFNGYSGLATDSAEALAARTHRRRGFMASGDYYDNSPNTGQRGEIQVIGARCYEAGVQITGWRNIHVSDLYVENSYQADVNRYWPPLGGPLSISPAGLDEFNEGVHVSGVIIRTDESLPAVFMRKMTRVKADIQVIGGRSVPLRLESCAGQFNVSARDFGTKSTGAFGDNTGSTSSAVVMYGNEGPIDITVHAEDTRGAGAQMEYAVYGNVSDATPVMVRGSSTGHLTSTIRDVVGNRILDLGLIDAAVRKLPVSAPVVLKNGLETHGSVDLISDSGDLNVNLRSANGTARKLNFITASGLQFQISQTSDGGVLFQQFTDGGFQRQPLRFDESGVLAIIGTWDDPLQTSTGWLWVSASGVLRIKSAQPTADSDGVAVGSQS